MNYLILIIVAIAGIALGMYLARATERERGSTEASRLNVKGGFIAKQMETKVENKQKILEFVQEKGRVQNNDVEKLVGVSNATAERYLDELEKEGRLVQHGTIGQAVFYTNKAD